MSSEHSAKAIRPTPIELTILELIAQDLSNKQIAKRINRAEFTIKSHITRLNRLSKTQSRTGLAVMFVMWKYMGFSNPYWDEPSDVYREMEKYQDGDS